MNSIILQTAARYLSKLMLLFSLWVLFRGHNYPGGGFIGGLIAASAFSLYLIAHGTEKLKKILLIEISVALGVGILCVFISGILGLLIGKPFLTSIWIANDKLGTPMLFDIGIYLVVVTSILLIIFSLGDES